MIVKLPLGNTNFREIRNEGYWYADKTSFLEDFLIAPPKASLFTRPRRFGKTLFMNMLSEFFDITKDSKGIFDGLSIAKNEQICKQWMNKYPAYRRVRRASIKGRNKWILRRDGELYPCTAT